MSLLRKKEDNAQVVDRLQQKEEVLPSLLKYEDEIQAVQKRQQNKEP